MWLNKRFVKVFQTEEDAYKTLDRYNYITYHATDKGIFVEFTSREFAEKAGGEWAFPEEETELILRNRRLTEFPEYLRKCVKLKKLVLALNNIEKIPDWICELTSLEELYLSSNKIKEIPPALGKMCQLRVVELNSNQIKVIPYFMRTLTLRSSNYGNNPIEKEETTPTGNSGTRPFPTAKEARKRSDETLIVLHKKYWNETLRQQVLEKIEEAIGRGETNVMINYPKYYDNIKKELNPLGYKVEGLCTCVTISW